MRCNEERGGWVLGLGEVRECGYPADTIKNISVGTLAYPLNTYNIEMLLFYPNVQKLECVFLPIRC